MLAFLPINTSAITRISKRKIADGKQFISVTHIKSLVNLFIVSKVSLLMTNTMIAMDVEANNIIVVFFMIEMPGLESSTTGANAIRAIKCAPIIGYGRPFAHIGKFIVVFANTKSSCQIIRFSVFYPRITVVAFQYIREVFLRFDFYTINFFIIKKFY